MLFNVSLTMESLLQSGVVLLLMLLFQHLSSANGKLPEIIKIGGLFEAGDDALELSFRLAVDAVNVDRRLLRDSRLSAHVMPVKALDSFHAARKVCEGLESGPVAILGPRTPEGGAAVRSTCEILEVPHLTASAAWGATEPRRSLRQAVNLHPSVADLSRALRDFVRYKDWRLLALLYQEDDALLRLQMLLKSPHMKDVKVLVQQFDDGGDYKKMLKKLRGGAYKNIIVDVPTDRIPTFLQDARDFDMFTEYYNYVFTSLDIHTLDLESYYGLHVNITAFRLVDMHSVEKAGDRWKQAFDSPLPLSKTEVALVYDAILVLASSLQNYGENHDLRSPNLSCTEETPWRDGHQLVSSIRSSRLRGLTGPIRFDSEGTRTDFILQIVDMTTTGFELSATWNSSVGISQVGNFSKSSERVMDSLRNKTLLITTLLSEPYVMWVKHEEGDPPLEGNARFEGFCIDLLDEISRNLEFNYILTLVPGGAHGKRLNDEGEWNGMIQELRTGRADIAIGDLTITHERQQVVDFTMPFMNLGISILFKKPAKTDPSLFSFLSPLSIEVWLYTVTSLLGITMLLYTLARFTPYQWENPHPCDPNPEELENSYDLKNTFWFTVTCLMQAGGEPWPKAISTRIVASMWWFFTLIMVSSYTANLAAFLTAQRMGTSIESVEALAKQTKIQYGCMESGSTQAFFKNTKYETYKKMWSFMQSSRPNVFTETNQKGVERVKKGNYAFLMESTSIEYLVERHCDLQRVGDPLDSKGYGIATPKGSPYLQRLSEEVVRMEEQGRLRALERLWWKQKIYGEHCPADTPLSSGALELSMKNVGGVFLVLILVNICAVFILLGEFIWFFRHNPREPGDNFVFALFRELRRILSGGGSSRPAPQDNESSPSPPQS